MLFKKAEVPLETAQLEHWQDALGPPGMGLENKGGNAVALSMTSHKVSLLQSVPATCLDLAAN